MFVGNSIIATALFLLSGSLCGASVVDPVPTFHHRDPVTGEILKCPKCPPGTFMSAYCTATTRTQCQPCRDGHFTDLWNYLPRCLYCSNICTGNQEVETECSPTTNRTCRCKEGFYSADDFCIRHTECGRGYGVQTKGTQQTNTVCEKCPAGYFSSSSSAVDLCVKHQECSSGQSVLLTGSAYSDTVCGTCESLANGGETLRTFLSGFFHSHTMRVGKMKKFVSKYILTSSEERCSLPKQREPLMDHIIDWLAKAPEEKLRKIPDMLRASELNSMAEKLKKRLHEIKQQNPNCSFTIDEVNNAL
ncbi:tumor necrosis factor receptor superfamily member 11B isoform X1 [Oreochromis niloticus]|uniref:Tumor necrosis factor receptor superfamily member 11B n=1 Tax=Oreochromis niloticus TaxID=8128 RepID=I3JJ46_ORENI|nr:tumor necrosis factor receptor superfamily member 11B isoform X1 [Oreochromis niloticus]